MVPKLPFPVVLEIKLPGLPVSAPNALGQMCRQRCQCAAFGHP